MLLQQNEKVAGAIINQPEVLKSPAIFDPANNQVITQLNERVNNVDTFVNQVANQAPEQPQKVEIDLNIKGQKELVESTAVRRAPAGRTVNVGINQ